LLRRGFGRQHLSMTSRASIRSRVRLGVLAVAAALAVVSMLAAAGVASGAAVRRQPGFGAAARIAVDHAAARLAPHSGISGSAPGR
jgi:Tfp pilus assembly protein PilN